jgi:hypothetical protein
MGAPAAEGVRAPYDALPPDVRGWLDTTVGSPVVRATTQVGGFSPGVAARLECSDGTRAFVKAVSAEVNAESVTLHRREAEVLRLLPDELPVPRLLAAYDEDPWLVLLIEDVAGTQPQLPWSDGELDRVLELASAVTAVTGVRLRPFSDHLEGWRGFAALAAGDGPADEWCRRHLADLAAMEREAEEAVAGDHLLHLDLRADNVLLSTGGDWLVDWPWASTGAAWGDVVCAAVPIAMQGGPPPEELLRRSGVVGPADEAGVTALLAAFTGLMLQQSTLPPPPGIPTVREFQAAQGRIALDWLRQRTGWR